MRVDIELGVVGIPVGVDETGGIPLIVFEYPYIDGNNSVCIKVSSKTLLKNCYFNSISSECTFLNF